MTDYARGPEGQECVLERAYRWRALLQAVAAGIFATALCLSMISLLVPQW